MGVERGVTMSPLKQQKRHQPDRKELEIRHSCQPGTKTENRAANEEKKNQSEGRRDGSWVKALAAKTDNLSSNPVAHMVE